MNRLRYMLPGGVILALAIIGALTQSISCLYAVVGGVCICVILVAFNKLGKRYYSYLIFGIGLALLYQTTLMSPGLVGTDIHYEYYFAWQAQMQGWDISMPHLYNSALGTVFVAPHIANLLNIDVIWILKAFYPLLFAFVPLILYYIYRKQFGDKVAFLGSFFFVIIPTYMLEMVGLPRQQLAELMFTICAFLIIISTLRLRIRVLLVILCAGLGITFHYTMGPIIIFTLAGCTLALGFFKRRTFPVKYMCIILAVLVVIGIGYYGSVASGNPLENISRAASQQLTKVVSLLPTPSETTTTPSETTTTPFPREVSEGEVIPDTSKMEGLDPLIRTALGLDFFEASPTGKVFRVFQYLTQICIVLGIIQLIFKKKRYSPEYLAFAITSIILLLASVVIPRFSTIINTTRVYHIGLLFLAPAVIIGGQLIFRNIRVLVLCLFIPYFLFTSGVVFEVAQLEDISKIDTPYSYVLSHERVDVCGVFTENDIAVRNWAIENKIRLVYVDTNSMLLFSERMKPDSWRKDYDYLLWYKDDPTDAYIYLSERNVMTQTLTFLPLGGSTGTRQSYSFEELGVDEIIANGIPVYQSGDAILLKVGSEK